MSKIGWLLLNSLTFIAAIFVNYYVNAQAKPGESIGEISDKFSTLITPADYAFAIWGIIYLGILAFIIYQWIAVFKKREDHLKEIGIWLAVVNIANLLWISSWMQLMTDTSVIIMFLLLLALIKLVVRLRLEIWDAPVRIIAFVWWPIALYLGWIILASAVNVAAWLVSIGWHGGMSETYWAVIILILAMGIYLWLIFARNLRESAMVGVWGIAAIAIRHRNAEEQLIFYVAIGVCVVLVLAAGYHGFINRETSPFKKIQRGEY